MRMNFIVKAMFLIQAVLLVKQANGIDYYDQGIDYWPNRKK